MEHIEDIPREGKSNEARRCASRAIADKAKTVIMM